MKSSIEEKKEEILDRLKLHGLYKKIAIVATIGITCIIIIVIGTISFLSIKNQSFGGYIKTLLGYNFDRVVYWTSIVGICFYIMAVIVSIWLFYVYFTKQLPLEEKAIIKATEHSDIDNVWRILFRRDEVREEINTLLAMYFKGTNNDKKDLFKKISIWMQMFGPKSVTQYTSLEINENLKINTILITNTARGLAPVMFALVMYAYNAYKAGEVSKAIMISIALSLFSLITSLVYLIFIVLDNKNKQNLKKAIEKLNFTKETDDKGLENLLKCMPFCTAKSTPMSKILGNLFIATQVVFVIAILIMWKMSHGNEGALTNFGAIVFVVTVLTLLTIPIINIVMYGDMI